MIALTRRRNSFTPPPGTVERRATPIVATMLASLAPLLPFVMTEPLLPPLGLMTFLAWRLLRNDVWPLWAGLPLGLWDDLFSGQPLGTAMAGWTMILLALDGVDRRLPWREFNQDWGIAALAVIGQLLLALLLARVTGGDTSPLLLLPQIAIAILAYPLVTRACATLDRWRFAR